MYCGEIVPVNVLLWWTHIDKNKEDIYIYNTIEMRKQMEDFVLVRESPPPNLHCQSQSHAGVYTCSYIPYNYAYLLGHSMSIYNL